MEDFPEEVYTIWELAIKTSRDNLFIYPPDVDYPFFKYSLKQVMGIVATMRQSLASIRSGETGAWSDYQKFVEVTKAAKEQKIAANDIQTSSQNSFAEHIPAFRVLLRFKVVNLRQNVGFKDVVEGVDWTKIRPLEDDTWVQERISQALADF
ncbi:hypothetical protein BDN70DRAFT_916457 [Pholiota conissans]|uniref:Uncharacterized protein n=1 Tax=Pholiota conissans TaxID=109636 RepID=A0A9P5ZGK4_9AGAR|nr:hypothetical protein BDN70DRAFT_916457 [Pholiota conissans]